MTRNGHRVIERAKVTSARVNRARDSCRLLADARSTPSLTTITKFEIEVHSREIGAGEETLGAGHPLSRCDGNTSFMHAACLAARVAAAHCGLHKPKLPISVSWLNSSVINFIERYCFLQLLVCIAVGDTRHGT
jgi:hypothetical protein